VIAALSWLGSRALDALLPPHCLTCDSPVASQGTQCGGCFAGLSFVSAPWCDRCGVPFPHEAAGQPTSEGLLCPACVAVSPAFEAARAALRYDDGARRLVLPFKHSDRTEMAAPLARHMARTGGALLARADLLVPVPLHWRRLLKRRYNQAGLLAARLARIAGKPQVPDVLRRLRATPPLAEHGAAERAALLEAAFTVPRNRAQLVAGRRILLIDDVMTSGATAEGCVIALLEAGAAAVDVLAAARVPDPRLEAAR